MRTSAIAGLEGNLPLHVKRIEVRHGGADLQDRKVEDRVKRRIRQAQPDIHSGPDTHGLKTGCGAVNQLANLRIGPDLAHEIGRGTCAEFGNGRFEILVYWTGHKRRVPLLRSRHKVLQRVFLCSLCGRAFDLMSGKRLHAFPEISPLQVPSANVALPLWVPPDMTQPSANVNSQRNDTSALFCTCTHSFYRYVDGRNWQ